MNEERIKAMPYRARILERVAGRIDKQTGKGLEKYGVELAYRADLTIRQRLELLAEELADGLVYIEDLIERVENLEQAVMEDVIAMVRQWFGGGPNG